MDRKFTLRIGDTEDTRLEEIKKLTGETTDSGAIKAVIRNYADLNDRYNNEMAKNRKLTEAYNSLNNRVEVFLSAFNALNNKGK